MLKKCNELIFWTSVKVKRFAEVKVPKIFLNITYFQR